MLICSKSCFFEISRPKNLFLLVACISVVILVWPLGAVLERRKKVEKS